MSLLTFNLKGYKGDCVIGNDSGGLNKEDQPIL